MRFVGRGHPAIRATHHKTLELSAEPGITARATCVVAVGAEAEPPAPMAGPVRIRIAVDDNRFSFDAVANPSWDPAGPVVVRRSALRLPGTFATDATAVAADLPRELVAALQQPDALVTVDVAPIPSVSPVGVLFAANAGDRAPSAALAAELERADEVIAEDVDARRLVGTERRGVRRTLVVATRELPGRTCADRFAGRVLDTVGLPAPLAVAAACPSRGPVTFGTEPDLLRTTPSTHRLVLPVGRDSLGALLQRAGHERGTGVATVAQEFGRPLLATADALPDLVGTEDVFCCLHPAPARDAVDPAVRAAVTALLADGVPTRTAARALAALTGWQRSRAYAAIIDWPTR
ncbi:MAG: DUF371 domain-containing protein [Jatrophihabitans sp.]